MSLIVICSNNCVFADKLIFNVGISKFVQIRLSLQIALIYFAICKKRSSVGLK
jgi:hypothetical protein